MKHQALTVRYNPDWMSGKAPGGYIPPKTDDQATIDHCLTCRLAKCYGRRHPNCVLNGANKR